MINSVSPSKPDKPGPIVKFIQKCLTLSDIENNLKKYSAGENFENFEEFLQKARLHTDEAYVNVKINLSTPLTPVEVPLDDLEPNEDPSLIRTENHFFLLDLQRRRTTNGSNLRFGIAPLESIEENMNEELLITEEFKNKYSHFSQQPSNQFNMNRTKGQVFERNKRIQRKKKFRSPYSEGISPSRLPAISRGEQTVKILRSFSIAKSRK